MGQGQLLLPWTTNRKICGGGGTVQHCVMASANDGHASGCQYALLQDPMRCAI